MSAPKTNRIKFDLNPEQIHQLTKEIIEVSTKIQDAVAAIPDGEHTFENTVLALADDDCEVSTLSSMVDFPQYVSTIPEIRDASSAASTELQKFQVESNMRRDVYKSLLKFRDSPHPELTPLQQRLFDRTLRDFKRNGLDLPDDKYDRLKEINKEISELGIKFQKNLNEENTKLEFTREELEGLPDDFFSGRETTPEGKFVVTLKYPDLLPIVQLAKRPETRKRINDVNALKLNEENTPLLERTLKLRREAAHLLGYPNHASYILEIRMAKSPELVKPFLADLSEKLDSAAHKELAVLQGLKEKELQELGREGESKEIFGHDFRYYHDKNLRDNYQVDDQAIKKYFPLDVVTKGMLSVYEDILSLRFEEIENPHVWFEEVKMFAVHDAETNEFMGHFYLDLFPRQGKYGHAAAFPLQPRHINRKTGEVQFPVAAMVANFSKPTPDKPSLLLFDEVVTFFHEFGHIMHGMCTRAEYSRFSGTSVERDFVEAPSQMLENWCYEPDVLRRISGHYEDHSKTLPEEMLQPLVRAKNADTGLLNRRQIFFGTFDQIVHSSEEDVDTGALWRQLRKEITLIPEAENANPAASFGHIMGGYDSQYYGYLYSEVFSADMYEKFKKEGVLSKQLGRLYRDVILAPGGSVDSMESLVKFLGREPTQDAFLRHIGIAPEQA